ncbi:MAG: HEAT repeat domain-containing protein [Oligoflexia bacterium]|nr:HEAT repeat domain-containing protein [Oligoflexia bacterium]
MKTSFLNSRKCSIASAVGLLLTLGTSTPLFTRLAQANSDTQPSQSALVTDINSERSPQFLRLLSKWQGAYGTSAVHPLISIAQDKRNSDRVRYIAIMGAAKLGGTATAPLIAPLLNDKIWLIRSAALRALSALKDPKTASAVLPLMKDPALAVRLEAVDAIRELRPPGASRALLTALHSQENYRFGKSQWVPEHSLQALAALKDPSIASELKPLLDHRKDPELQKETIKTLEALTGKKTDTKLSFEEQIESWKKN